MSEASKIKLSKAITGVNNYSYGKPMSEEHKKKISLALAGIKRRPMSEQGKQNISAAHKGQIPWNKGLAGTGLPGRKLSMEERLHLSAIHSGENSSSWKGGTSPINKRIRKSMDFRLWREKVFQRDDWTCRDCFQRGGILHPHHIKSFTDYPELRFAIDNGKTLCVACHAEEHKDSKVYNTLRKAAEQVRDSEYWRQLGGDPGGTDDGKLERPEEIAAMLREG